MKSFQPNEQECSLSLRGIPHSIFESISLMISTYEVVSMNRSATVGPYRARSFGIDGWFLDSIAGTLDSIRHALSRGHVADAYGLLRSIIERAWIHAYLLDRCNSYEVDPQIDVTSPEAFADFFLELIGTEEWFDRAIEDWVAGRKSLPTLREIRPSLQVSQNMQELNALFPASADKEVSDRCNDHLHINFAKHLRAHYDHPNGELVLAADQLEKDVCYVVTKHLTQLFFFQQPYMSSSDYIDALDIGVEPAEDSQYWVASGIQEFFDKLVSPIRRDIVVFLQKHTLMHLE